MSWEGRGLLLRLVVAMVFVALVLTPSGASVDPRAASEGYSMLGSDGYLAAVTGATPPVCSAERAACFPVLAGETWVHLQIDDDLDPRPVAARVTMRDGTAGPAPNFLACSGAVIPIRAGTTSMQVEIVVTSGIIDADYCDSSLVLIEDVVAMPTQGVITATFT